MRLALLVACSWAICPRALKTGARREVDEGAAEAEAGWHDPDIVLERRKWKKLPELFAHGEPRPHPPSQNYHDERIRNGSSIVVLIAALGETRTARTLQTMFERASNPGRVYAGVVQQNGQDDADALEEFCRLRRTPLELAAGFAGRAGLHRRQRDEDAWEHSRYTPESLARCEPASRVRMYRMDRTEAKGPAYARARQPLLLSSGDAMEDFCLQIDAHTIFTNGWDDHMVKEWAATDNEYAVLTSYPTNANWLPENGTEVNVNDHWEMPHLCEAYSVGEGMIRNSRAGAVANLRTPALTKFWAAGLSFSKCHAERDVPADMEHRGIFSGEEFVRGARLWTNGYDMYSMMRPTLGTYYGGDKRGGGGGGGSRPGEMQRAIARMKTLLRMGTSDQSPQARAALKGFDLGTRRRYEDYIALSGMDTVKNRYMTTPCTVPRWTPWLDGSQPPYSILEGSPVVQGTAISLASAEDAGAR